MFEKYFDQKQQEELKKRKEELGEETIRAAEKEWPTFISNMKAHMEKGTAHTDPEVLKLGRRWQELVAQFTGGDPAMDKNVTTLYRNEPKVRAQYGLEPKLMEYVSQVMTHLK